METTTGHPRSKAGVKGQCSVVITDNQDDIISLGTIPWTSAA
jgi:hypothetical protein